MSKIETEIETRKIEKTKCNIKFSKENFVDLYEGYPGQKYNITKTLGGGGQATVYEVQNKKTGRLYACKYLSKNKKSNLKKYIKEIKILSNADHPNIIKLYEVIETKNSLYLILEECKGGELFDHITSYKKRKGRMYSEEEAANIMIQLLSAINYCHNNGICHRDLKPENLIYLNEGDEDNNQIKIIDFGLSEIFKEGQIMHEKYGTSYYVSPEILRGCYTKKCDIWSAGVILYILLSGTPPFNGENDSEIYNKIKKMKFDFPDSKWYNISPEAKDLIRQMLSIEAFRPNVKQVLNHPWFKKFTKKNEISFINEINDLDDSNLKEFKNFSPLKKMGLIFIAGRVDENDEDIQKIQKFFQMFDSDNDGQINFEEFKIGINKLKGEKDISEEEVKEIFEGIDMNKNGKIDYTEFLAANLKSEKYLQKNCLKEAFHFLEDKESKKINLKKLLEVLQVQPEDYKSFNEVNKILSCYIKNCDITGNDCNMDTDSDSSECYYGGTIDKKDFYELMGYKKIAN